MDILAEIDKEIERLQQARAVLSGIAGESQRRLGRSPKSTTAKPTAPKKRVFSEETRARMVAGQKKRWAALKRAAK
jgi:hypothetical protein